MTPLTVACVFVQGPYPYTAEYVYRLRSMVRRYLARPFTFVCLTDRPEMLPGIQTIRIASTLGSPESVGYWTKLRLFDRSIGLTGRVLFLDLDVLIVSDLSPIVDQPAPFTITADELVGQRPMIDADRHGRMVIRRFNSSVMVFDAGCASDLFDRWTAAASARLSTDQDWIAEQRPHAATMPCDWFPRISLVQPPWPDEAKVVLCKKPKNHEAAERWPWFAQAWRAA